MEGFSAQQLHHSSSFLPYRAAPQPEPLPGFPVRSGLEAAMAYDSTSSSSLDTSSMVPMVYSPMAMQLHESVPPEAAAGVANGDGGCGRGSSGCAAEKRRMVGIQEGGMTSPGSTQQKDGSGGKSRKQKRLSNLGVKGAEGKRARGHDGEPPAGYIHVRARRGQATDSHSLAERLRREKIGEKMKMLESLVPGCDKVTGKAQMLDEIISYVQLLQNQVEFLSMKVASLDPMLFGLELDIDMYPTAPQLVKMASQMPHELVQCMGQGNLLTTGPAAAAAHVSLEAQGPTSFGQDGSSSRVMHAMEQRLQEGGEGPLHQVELNSNNIMCFFQ
ncbi:hypothetical protein ACP4OV_016320 [Aristida adscensionis]